MKSRDPRIDAHIAKAADFAQPVLRHLRALVHEACPEVEETLKWSSPTFLYSGRILCGMVAFKNHCTFGFWHKGMEEVLDKDGAKGDQAWGSLGRLTCLADLPSDKALLRREYVEWITEAKRDETRVKRLATTLEWLAEGKPRNWKYENC